MASIALVLSIVVPSVGNLWCTSDAAAARAAAAAAAALCVAGMASIALVLSIVVPSVGNWWYLLTLLTPAAWFYYFQKGERVEQVTGCC
jgi:hypothetical protein